MPACSKSPLGSPRQSPRCRFPNSRNRATSAARAHVLACLAPDQPRRKGTHANNHVQPCFPWMCAGSAMRSGEIPIGATDRHIAPDHGPSPCPVPAGCEILQAMPYVLWRRFLECMFPTAAEAVQPSHRSLASNHRRRRARFQRFEPSPHLLT